MIVGITRVQVVLPGNESLKGKRSALRRTLERIRARFHVSAAEVDDHDRISRGVIGIVTVGVDGRKVESVLAKVVEFIEGTGLVQVLAVETEIAGYNELFGEVPTYAEKFGLADDTEPAAASTPGPKGRGRGRIRLRPGSLGFGSQRLGEEDG